ncbi:MAG: CotH kinase family protein [Chitinophagales bacterium]
MKQLLIFIVLLNTFFSRGQSLPYNILFDDEKVNSIFIIMDEDSLNEMYNELENEHEYAVQFIYDEGTGTDTLENVGFRLRGNTSLGSAKKSFKVSFNTYNAGRKYHAVEKMNLIGNHNDPSMSREKLYFDIYNAFGLPVRRVSFVKVFINDDYYGLYTNTEEYDEIFLKDRFGENTGNLYKCLYGSNLEYKGTNPLLYGSYELLTNEEENDYSDLMNLTDVITNTPIEDLPCELEKFFNVDNFLKIYAIDIATGHWDNYGLNQNNFYLYHNQFTGQFEFLSYDCDNTLGVDWFGIDWAERDIYDWNFDDRPLVERLFQIDDYKNRFSYYMNELINTVMLPEVFFPHIDSVKELITPAALEDEYKGYDYGYTDDDFLNSFDTDDIDGHTPYGIKNFIEKRNAETTLQIELNDIFPVASEITHAPLLPAFDENIDLTLYCLDDEDVISAELIYNIDGDAVGSLEMYDDGLHNDAAANDNIFGVRLETPGAIEFILYNFEITDNTGNVSVYPSCGQYQLKIGFNPPTLVINELMAINDSTVIDNAGDNDDYVEIYNPGSSAIYLGDYYLSDDFTNPAKWKLPEVTLLADDYILLWADNETEEGEEHCDFKLSGSGEQLGLFAGVSDYFSAIDTISFGMQTADISFGRIPNGSGNFVLLTEPSPGENNEKTPPPTDTTFQFLFSVLGNPITQNSIVQLQLMEEAAVQLDIFSLNGQLVFPIEENTLSAGSYVFTIDNRQFGSGMYFLRLLVNGEQTIYKLMQQ